jgi:hypothetical protein
VHKVLTAPAADIKKAFDELTKDLKAAGGSAKGLAESSKKASIEAAGSGQAAGQRRLQARGGQVSGSRPEEDGRGLPGAVESAGLWVGR